MKSGWERRKGRRHCGKRQKMNKRKKSRKEMEMKKLLT
jgi:hypothetical protein